MENENVIASLSKRAGGEIYLGVVGAVRTGKSTFIKRFIEGLVVPNITDEYEKKKVAKVTFFLYNNFEVKENENIINKRR